MPFSGSGASSRQTHSHGHLPLPHARDASPGRTLRAGTRGVARSSSGVQQSLHALRISLSKGLGELPAVLALDPAEQTDEVGTVFETVRRRNLLGAYSPESVEG
jgi:hypothetical protein